MVEITGTHTNGTSELKTNGDGPSRNGTNGVADLKPNHTSRGAECLTRLREEHPDLNFLRFQWQDYSGVVRARVVPIDLAIEQVRPDKPLKGYGIALCLSVDNHMVTGTPTDGQYWMIPDWDTLHPTATPGSAQVMCALDYILPGNPMTQAFCPRHTLARVVEQARRDWSLDFLVGFEVEFVVMRRRSGGEEPARERPMELASCGWGLCSVAGLRDPTYRLVERVVLQLRARGVDIQTIHTEGVRGQYELILGPRQPLQAVDQLMLVQSYLKDAFAAEDLTVTMMPRPVPGKSLWTGQHMHISLQPAASEAREQSFLAGLMRRLPSLIALCMPQEVSYERLKPFLAGADTACWGTECRLVPVRKVRSSWWELRPLDGMANPYLVVAGVIAAGLCGLAGEEPLTWPDLGDPANADADRGQPLPKNLNAALDVLEADEGNLAAVLGRPMIDRYVGIKRYENASLAKLDPKEVHELFIELF